MRTVKVLGSCSENFEYGVKPPQKSQLLMYLRKKLIVSNQSTRKKKNQTLVSIDWIVRSISLNLLSLML